MEINVQDIGIGICYEKVDKIFMPFYRINKGTLDPIEGFGLSLSIVQRIAVRQYLYKFRKIMKSELISLEFSNN